MSERNEQQDHLLDRATAALRDEAVPPVPAGLIERTQAAVREELSLSRPAEPVSPFRHPLFRVAAVVALGACGVAAYVALRGRSPQSLQVTTSQQPVPSGVPEIRDPKRLDPSAPAVAVTTSGTVHGLVRFTGPAPKPQVISMAANAACASHHRGQVMDESVLANDDGTLRNVVVWVSAGLEGRKFAPPKEPAVLDQQGCVYTPHVVTVMTGQRLLVKNSDPFLHNVRAAAANNPPFNFGQPTVDNGTPLVFLSPERMFVKCDVHPWMSAFVHVLDNPFFAVTGEHGAFTLPDLPAGTYTVSAWHEVFGEQQQQVTVEPGKPLELQFTFSTTQQAGAGHDPAGAPCCKHDGPTYLAASR